MASQVETRTLVKWLLDHGFEERAGSATSHRQFVSKEPNIAITVPGHGPKDLTKKHVGLILRSLTQAGFDKKKTRRELESSKWQ